MPFTEYPCEHGLLARVAYITRNYASVYSYLLHGSDLWISGIICYELVALAAALALPPALYMRRFLPFYTVMCRGVLPYIFHLAPLRNGLPPSPAAWEHLRLLPAYRALLSFLTPSLLAAEVLSALVCSLLSLVTAAVYRRQYPSLEYNLMHQVITTAYIAVLTIAGHAWLAARSRRASFGGSRSAPSCSPADTDAAPKCCTADAHKAPSGAAHFVATTAKEGIAVQQEVQEGEAAYEAAAAGAGGNPGSTAAQRRMAGPLARPRHQPEQHGNWEAPAATPTPASQQHVRPAHDSTAENVNASKPPARSTAPGASGTAAFDGSMLAIQDVLSGGGLGARYKSSARPIRVCMKLPFVEPSDLRPAFLAQLNAALEQQAAVTGPCSIVGCAVRAGCIELTLDLMPLQQQEAAGAGGSEGAAAEAEAARRELPWRILRLLEQQFNQQGPEVGLDPSTGARLAPLPGQRVMLHAGTFAMVAEWDADAQRWQPLEPPAGGGAGFEAPTLPKLAWAPAAAVLTAGAASGQQPLQLDIALLHSDCGSFGHGGPTHIAGSSGTSSTNDSSSGFVVDLVVKANGRSTVAALVPAAASRASGGSGAVAKAQLNLPPDTGPVPYRAELDVACLLAGRPVSAGLVLSLELWAHTQQQPVAAPADEGGGEGWQRHAPSRWLCGVWRLALLPDAGAVAELLQAVAVDELGRSDRGSQSGWVEEEVEEAERDGEEEGSSQQLLGDLCVWCDFVAANAGTEGPEDAPEEDACDQSRHLQALLRRPIQHEAMLAIGRELLSFTLEQGWVCLARRLAAQLAGAEGVALGELACRPAKAWGGGLTLLHVAVRGRIMAAVRELMGWLRADGAPDAVGRAWHTPGPAGITPLELLVALGRGADLTVTSSGCAGNGGCLPCTLQRWVLRGCPDGVDEPWECADGHISNRPAGTHAAAAATAATASASAGVMEVTPVAADGCIAASVNLMTDDAVGSCSNAAASSPRHGITSGACMPAPSAPCACSGAPAHALGGQLLRACFRGFEPASLERSYVQYVTDTRWRLLAVWVTVMLAVHVAAYQRGETASERNTTLIGAAAYAAVLALRVLAPAQCAQHRELLMMACCLARSINRIAPVVLPGHFAISPAVARYLAYGVDVLLEGLLQGAFEQMRMPRALLVRLVDTPLSAALHLHLGLCGGAASALGRSLLTNAPSVLLSLAVDYRQRAEFTRAHAAAAAAARLAADWKKAA